MITELVTLIAALIAAVASVMSVVLAARRERQNLVWSKEVDRFIELEELAGELVEQVSGYQPIPEDSTALAESFHTLEMQAGRFARYPQVRQAVRDLHNVLGRMFVAKRDREDDRGIRNELDPAHRKLLQACDAVLRDRKL